MLDENYFNRNIIGVNNQSPDCVQICFIKDNAMKSKDKYIARVVTWITTSVSGIHQEGSQKLAEIAAYVENQFMTAAIDMFTKHELLFNSIICTEGDACNKITGIEQFSLPIKFMILPSTDFEGFADFRPERIDIDIDFDTAQVYTKELLDQYQESHIRFLCEVKKLTALFFNMRMEEGDVNPQGPINEYCEPFNGGS